MSLALNPSEIGTAGLKSASSAGRAYAAPLASILAEATGTVRNKRTGRQNRGSANGTTNCTGGGTRTEVSQWTGDNSNPTNYTGTITYVSCKEGTETWNGSSQITYNGTESAPTAITVALDMAYSNGTVTNLTFTGSTITYDSIVYTADGSVASFNATLSGKVSGTLNGKALSAVYNAFKLGIQYGTSAAQITISGSVNPKCANAPLNVSTATALTFSYGNGCPTAGVMAVTDGANTATVTHSSNGSVTVSLNGVQVAAYGSCGDAEGFCS